MFITGRRQEALDAAVTAIGPMATGMRADASNLSDLSRLFDQVRAQAARIDVLFVNAGGGTKLPLGSITEDQYDSTFNSNVRRIRVNTLSPGPIRTPLLLGLAGPTPWHSRAFSIAPQSSGRRRCQFRYGTELLLHGGEAQV